MTIKIGKPNKDKMPMTLIYCDKKEELNAIMSTCFMVTERTCSNNVIRAWGDFEGLKKYLNTIFGEANVKNW